jgi:hypothetical protein
MKDETVVIGKYRIINFPSTATLIGLGLINLAMGIVGLLFFVAIPPPNVSTLNIVAGIILGWGSAVVAFYFGDSKKSAQQQDTINTLAQGPESAAAVQMKAAKTQDHAADTQAAAAAKKAGK